VPAPKKRPVLVVAAVAVAVIAAIGWFAFRNLAGQPQAAVPAPPPSVGVQVVTQKGVNRTFEFVGRIKAVNEVELRARVEGFLEKVLFTEGQHVKTGQLLYQIEKVQYQAEVDRIKANIAIDEAELTNAQVQYDRSFDLAKQNFSAQALVDTNKAKLENAKGKLLYDKAALLQAQANLDYTDIRSPIDGRIGRIRHTIGNLVNPASGALALIVSQDPIYVEFPVSVRDLHIIRDARRDAAGAAGVEGVLAKIEIRVRLSDGQEYQYPGTWNFTQPRVDRQTDSLIIRATLPNPGGVLEDGEFVTVMIREKVEEQRLVVPQAALQVDQTGYYALIVDKDHRVVQRRVKTGPNEGADVVVVSGLEAGDKVIVDGIQKVRPGQIVKAMPLPAGG
jgi:membrane fusion protein (multidrug efflux system)